MFVDKAGVVDAKAMAMDEWNLGEKELDNSTKIQSCNFGSY